MYRTARIGVLTLAVSSVGATSFSRAADTSEGRQGDLSVAEMMGPMSDAPSLFSKIRVEHDYRDFPGMQLDSVRTAPLLNGQIAYWPGEAYVWADPSFGHKPLYFEQTNLERYGWQSPRCLHPTLSAVHFFGSVGMLPVSWLRYPPHQCVSTAGHFRPGTCF